MRFALNRPDRKSIIDFGIRFGLIFVAFSLIYLAYFFTVKKPSTDQTTPVSRASLQTKLKEHTLTIFALKDIDTYDPSTPYKIEGVRSSVDSSLKSYQEELANYTKDSPTINIDGLDGFYEQEKNALADFDRVYDELQKITIYTLDKDIGALNPVADKNEIRSRLDKSIQEIEKVRGINQNLSNKSKSDIDKSLVCIKAINKTIPENVDKLRPAVAKCDKIFLMVSRSVMQDIVLTLDTEEINQLVSRLNNLSLQLK